MIIFLLTIVSIYGAVHVYAFLKVRAAFHLGPAAAAALGLFMALMTFAPLLVRVLERHEFELPARLTACIGYTWMGTIFLFFSLSLTVDLYRLFIDLAGFTLGKDLSAFAPTARFAFLAPLCLALVLSIYGYREALHIRTEHITVESDKLPKGTPRIRIVQLSDVHLGIIVREKRLKRILEAVEKADPDIIVSTGDLVDGQIDNLAGPARMFEHVRPHYGKYAVTGNHEFYAGLNNSLEFMTRAGFTVLRAEAVTVDGLVTVAGVDDPTGKQMGLYKTVSEREMLSKLPRHQFTILLKHPPVVAEGSEGLFDLQLSGHTHRGQIFPFGLLVQCFFPRIAGWYELPAGGHLYVSRGTGTWGPPMRLLSPPEITVIDLTASS